MGFEVQPEYEVFVLGKRMGVITGMEEDFPTFIGQFNPTLEFQEVESLLSGADRNALANSGLQLIPPCGGPTIQFPQGAPKIGDLQTFRIVARTARFRIYRGQSPDRSTNPPNTRHRPS